MKNKELLQQLKELRLKANPKNWKKSKDHELVSSYYLNGEQMLGNSTSYGKTLLKCKDDYLTKIKYIYKYQLKVLEIENALYGYWERNRFYDDILSCEDEFHNKDTHRRLFTESHRGNLFSEWLEDEMNNLDKE